MRTIRHVIFGAAAICLTSHALAQRAAPCQALGAACDAAIDSDTDAQNKARNLYDRAWLKVEKQDLTGAKADLDMAIALNPEQPGLLQERAYVLNAMGEYVLAEADLEARLKLAEPNVNFYHERAYARGYLANFTGALADKEKVVELTPNDVMALVTRAEALRWVGRFADARRDAEAARALAQKAGNNDLVKRTGETADEIELWSRTSGGDAAKACLEADKRNAYSGATVIGDCTAAFLAAHDGATRADFLTVRSLAWLVGQQNEWSATYDLHIAAALDPGNPDRHANLGSSLVRARHSWAAEREFDKALAIKRDWPALAGRASARLNQNNVAGAREDAQASLKIKPNETAFMVLGDIAMVDTGDKAAAMQYWLNAYRQGSRDDGLIERLKSVGITDPSKETQ